MTDWFETGLYLPLYSHDKNYGATIDGFKIRELFTVPHADDRRFVYGVNFEFNWNSRHWDASRFTSEIRPIIGWHLKPWDIIVNPIVDTAYDGLKNVDFTPAVRVAYNLSPIWAIAAEDYSDFGPLRAFNALTEQSHQLYAVVDHTFAFGEIEAGAGFGLTATSDGLTFKLLLTRDLNRHARASSPP